MVASTLAVRAEVLPYGTASEGSDGKHNYSGQLLFNPAITMPITTYYVAKVEAILQPSVFYSI